MIGLVVFLLGMAVLRLMGGSETRRTWSGRSGRCLVAWLVVGPVWLACILGTLRGLLSPAIIGLGTVSTLVLFPWPIARAVLIPLGLVRSAFWLTRLADWTWGKDAAGGAAVAAVLAAAVGRRAPASRPGRLWHRLAVRPSDVVFARERVQRLDLLGAAGATAAALLADLDDDDARGDALAETVAWFDPEVVPEAAARLLAERSLVRLFAREELDPTARRARVLALPARGSATVRFVQAVLRRDVDDGLGNRAAVAWWWLAAPRRRRTWPLVRGHARILPDDAAPPRPSTPAPTAPPDEGLAHAARRHLELTARGGVGLEDVVALAQAWEAALPGALEHLRRRAVSLKVDGDVAAAELQATVTGSLRQHVETLDLGQVDLRSLPSLLQVVVAEVRSERQDALEIAVAAWRSRLEAHIERAPVDELREWAALRTLADAVARTGVDGRYLAWEASQWVTCELAVHLWNVRHEHRLANAIFRSLLEAAKDVGDVRAEETQRANVACGP